jgi:hypothetical protein
MRILDNLAGGLAGTMALTLLHETYRQVDPYAPRIDLVGEEAITKLSKKAGLKPPTGDNRYLVTLAGDIVSNTLYFSLIGTSKKKFLLYSGAVAGLAAGVGALTLAKPLGLSNAPITRKDKTKVLTVAWYLAGGLVAAMAMRALRK